MQASPPTSRPRIRAWLSVHWLAIAGTALTCSGIFCLLPTSDRPVPSRPATVSLNQRQVRQALRVQAARLDSIKRELQKIPALTQARDSALAVARRHNAHANHLLTLLAHEAPSTTASTPTRPAERLARALAAYQPGSYALDSTHSLR